MLSTYRAQKILYCLLLSHIAVASFSQPRPARSLRDSFPFCNVDYYDSKQGFNGNNVYWAAQDKHGFLWFMSDNILNRFDGYSFRAYSNNFDAKSIRRGQYWGISEDNDGKLWIPGYWQELYSYDPYQENFNQYRPQKNNQQSLSTILTTAVAVDGNSDIWVG